MKQKIALVLHKLRVPADALTYLGLGAALASGVLISQWHFFWGAMFLLLSGGLDMLDGAVARLEPNRGRFGGILDSSLDRYGDGFLFGGIIFYYVSFAQTRLAAAAFAALLGAFFISYVRARAECEMQSCRVGFWERGERLVYVALGLLLNNLDTAIWVLAVATNATGLFRLVYARDPKGWDARVLKGRQNSRYGAKLVLYILIVLLVRF